MQIAKENNVQAIHPGYGFLSERADFAEACAQEGIVFVGPTVANLAMFGDKTAARHFALSLGVPCVPGTDGPVTTVAQARRFIEGDGEGNIGIGYPVICKAAMGGGGRGMRIIGNSGELEEGVTRCTSEALSAFGDGSIFIERCGLQCH